MTGGHLHWLWWAGGVVVTLLSVALLLWALFADRARGRRRCPKCWYDLSGTEGTRCSECGHEAAGEKRLFRTRRRWKWCLLACCSLVIWPTFLGWQGVRLGWVKVAPTTLLIYLLPVEAAVTSPRLELEEQVWDELNTRLGGFDPFAGYPLDAKDKLWSWQLVKLQRKSRSILTVDGLWQRHNEAINILTIESNADDKHVFDLLRYVEGAGQFDYRAVVAIDMIASRDRISAKVADKAVDRLLERLRSTQDTDSSVPLMMAIAAFGESADQAVPEFIRHLNSDMETQRQMVAFALGEIGEPAIAALPFLIELANSSNDQEATAAIRVLGHFPSACESTFPILQAALQGDSIEKRAVAALAFEDLADERAIPLLIEALHDSEAWVRWNSASALGTFGYAAEEALPDLRRCANDSDPNVRDAVHAAIAAIEGSDN